MGYVKKTICSYPGCCEIINGGRFCSRHAKQPRPRLERSHWSARSNEMLYNTTKWRALKRKIIATFNACAICGSQEGLEVHHIEPPRGDENLFFAEDNLCVLCHQCHVRVTNREIAGRKKGGRK